MLFAVDEHACRAIQLVGELEPAGGSFQWLANDAPISFHAASANLHCDRPSPLLNPQPVLWVQAQFMAMGEHDGLLRTSLHLDPVDQTVCRAFPGDSWWREVVGVDRPFGRMNCYQVRGMLRLGLAQELRLHRVDRSR
ncbi:MAG: hypothetical protein CMP23_09990 [Rickettsiales bacterium]|nr:hypothetical protein [Rickettsiales bacterium]